MCHRGNSGHSLSYIDFTSGSIWTSGMRLDTSLPTAQIITETGCSCPTTDGCLLQGMFFPQFAKHSTVCTHILNYCYFQSCPTLQCHGLQHTRLPCPLPSPGVCSNSCPLNWWCHPTISSSVGPFSSYLQYFPASGSFPMSQPFTPGGQSTGASASASVLPMNIQGWFPLELTGLTSLQSNGLSRVFSLIKWVQKHQFFSAQSSLWSNSHPHMGGCG